MPSQKDKYKCERCNKCFSCHTGMKRHFALHAKLDTRCVFKCDIVYCYREFQSASELQDHLLTHLSIDEIDAMSGLLTFQPTSRSTKKYIQDTRFIIWRRIRQRRYMKKPDTLFYSPFSSAFAS